MWSRSCAARCTHSKWSMREEGLALVPCGPDAMPTDKSFATRVVQFGGCRPLWQVWQHHQADLPPRLRHRDAQLVPCCDWGVNVHYLRRFDAMQMWLLARSLYPGRPHNTEWTWYHVGTHHGPLLRISLAVQLPVKETKNTVRKIKKPISLIVHSERITVRDRATRK